jgi:hypothetical protein
LILLNKLINYIRLNFEVIINQNGGLIQYGVKSGHKLNQPLKVNIWTEYKPSIFVFLHGVHEIKSGQSF